MSITSGFPVHNVVRSSDGSLEIQRKKKGTVIRELYERVKEIEKDGGEELIGLRGQVMAIEMGRDQNIEVVQVRVELEYERVQRRKLVVQVQQQAEEIDRQRKELGEVKEIVQTMIAGWSASVETGR